jgi:Outer membrane protein beta-barrel domain
MRNLLMAAALALCAATTYAQGIGPDAYVGAGVTQARIDDIFDSGHSLDLNHTAWKVFVGIRPVAPFAIEADYMDLGSETRHFGFDTGTHADAHAFAAFGVALLPLPLPFIDVFAKAGAARWSLSGSTSPSLFAIDEHGTDFAWGLGAQAHFGALGLRLEYEQFDVRDTSGLKAISFDAIFHFL